jgi:hypothetical protein
MRAVFHCPWMIASTGLGIHPGHQTGIPTLSVHACQPAFHAFAQPLGAAALDPEVDEPDPHAAAVTTTATRSTIARRCQGLSAANGFVGGALAPIRS